MMRFFTGAATIAVAGAGSLYTTDAVLKYVPVTAWMEATPIDFGDVWYAAEIVGYKLRDCVIVKDKSLPDDDGVIGWKWDGAAWEETPLTFPGDESPGSSNPSSVSLQSFGVFKWHELEPTTKRVKATALHNCDGSLTITTVGPFAIFKDHP